MWKAFHVRLKQFQYELVTLTTFKKSNKVVCNWKRAVGTYRYSVDEVSNERENDKQDQETNDVPLESSPDDVTNSLQW